MENVAQRDHETSEDSDEGMVITDVDRATKSLPVVYIHGGVHESPDVEDQTPAAMPRIEVVCFELLHRYLSNCCISAIILNTDHPCFPTFPSAL